jgi:dTDP-glucose 4,6-dehydratase
MKIVITGGAGFIGSHIVDFFVLKYPSAEIVIIDKMTYASDFRYLKQHLNSVNFTLIVGDICDKELCDKAMESADLLIHAAAESHVDNSFESSLIFTKTNVLGTHTVMQSALKNSVAKILHISTDEVYGEVMTGAVNEESVFAPTNPYSASKAAAEMIVKGYIQSFGLPAIIVRANNMFGTRQFPEKLIPGSLIRLMSGEKITLHGSGLNKRTFLSVYDFCDALYILTQKGKLGEAYNIGTEQEYENVEVARMICSLLDVDESESIVYIKDRPFNDARYSVDYQKIVDLGWNITRDFENELPSLAAWYRARLSYFSRSIKLVIT